MDPTHISGIRGIVFDLDDTLYPERSYAFSGFAAVSRWLRVRHACPFDPEERMKALFETEYRPRVFDRVLVELGLPPSEAAVSEMVDCYRSHIPKISLYHDADAALTRWSGAFRLGLISDGPEGVQRRKIDALGLSGRIEQVILTDTWGREYWKPHVRGFRAIEAAWGWDESSLLYVADNPSKDFLAPRCLGWRTLKLCRPDGLYTHLPTPAAAEPEFTVASLDQVEVTS